MAATAGGGFGSIPSAPGTIPGPNALFGTDKGQRAAGVTGVNTDNGGIGVAGVGGNGANGFIGGIDPQFHQFAGVYGESGQQGVVGHSFSNTGTGVYGSGVGGSFGVRGDTTGGIAVQGQSFGAGLAGKFIGNVEVTGKITHNGHFSCTGDVEVTGKITHNGDFSCTGDIRLVNADCAEEFDTIDTAEPGTVMVVDDAGTIHAAAIAYDTRVAGIVSGAGAYRPALTLDHRAGSIVPRCAVALLGKVFCKVDADQAPIRVGDLLTTSSTPGHAMKAVDRVQAFGAIIGKALQPLPAGRGLISVLVALQ